MIEEFFQFGETTIDTRFRFDKPALRLLNKYSKRSNKYVHVLNAYSGKTLKYTTIAPKDLPMASQNEAVHCSTCDTYIHIRRVFPKITSSNSLSPKYSTYITKPLEYCKCKSSAVMVDHRGILRLYGESLKLSLINYLSDFPIHHKLYNQKHAQISSNLLDGIKPRYERITKPRWAWKSNMLDLTNLTLLERNILIPIPISSYGRSRSTDRVVKDYYQNYAYNHNILILTTSYIILPSGISIPRRDPLVVKLLDPNITATRNTFQISENVNRLAEEFNRSISEAYSLPYTPLRYHPFQLLGYLQIVQVSSTPPISVRGKLFIQVVEAKSIHHTRRVSAMLLRDMLLGTNSMSRITIRNFQKIIPPVNLMYSARFTRTPQVPKQVLVQRNRKILVKR